MLTLDLDKAADKAAGNWKKFPDFAWFERPDDANDYTLVYTSNRDSGLLAQSNGAIIDDALRGFDDDVIPQHHSHWACGWVDGYAIRVRRDGIVTDAFTTYFDLMQRLEEYPVLDDEDYSQREYEATLDNLRDAANGANYEGLYRLPDDWLHPTFDWLWNNGNELENTDDEGGYPSREALHEAWNDLGYRVKWVVQYFPAGQCIERYSSEYEAEQRVLELRAAGDYSATYFPEDNDDEGQDD